MRVIYADLNRCLGCLSCQRACMFRQMEQGRGTTPNIWIYVDMERRVITAATCLQCSAAFCMRACPTGALKRDPQTHAVVVDRGVCVGCGVCIMACPFGYVHLEPAFGVAAKCDLCDGNPRCVQVCMAHALHFADLNELAELKRKRCDAGLVLRAVHEKAVPEK